MYYLTEWDRCSCKHCNVIVSADTIIWRMFFGFHNVKNRNFIIIQAGVEIVTSNAYLPPENIKTNLKFEFRINKYFGAE